jgi:hypothetical protein
MKIEINIDIEQIVREEIRNILRENLVINNVSGAPTTSAPKNVVTVAVDKVVAEELAEVSSEPAADTPAASTDTAEAVEDKSTTNAPIMYEFAPKPGRRRSKAEIAMHEQELKLGRVLTPAEKGIADANTELADEAQQTAKDATKQAAHIQDLVDEAGKGADEDIAKENADTSAAPVFMSDALDGGPVDDSVPFDADSPEAESTTGEEEIPKTEGLGNINSLFS